MTTTRKTKKTPQAPAKKPALRRTVKPADAPTGKYARHLPGPSLTLPFTVTGGTGVVVYGDTRDGLVLLPGMTWPGGAALPDEVAELLQPGEAALLGTDTTVRYLDAASEVDSAAIRLGATVVRAMTCARQGVERRLKYLSHNLGVSLLGVNDTTLAAAVCSTRETVTKVRPLLPGGRAV